MKPGQLFTFFILSLTGSAAHPQDSVHLGLQQAITAAVTNNNAARLSALDITIAQIKRRQTDALFLPQVNFSYTAVVSDNPLNAFGFKLQQQTVTQADFHPELLNNPGAASNFSTKMEWQQPLLNLDILYQRRAAAKQVEMYKLLSVRTRDLLLYETEKTYLQLQLSYDAFNVLNEAHHTAKKFCKIARDYFNQGLLQKSDLLNAELQVVNAEIRLNNAQSGIQDASDRLGLLMGQPAGTVYTTDPTTQNRLLLADSLSLSGNRADLSALQKGMEGYDMQIRSARMSQLPKINAFALYQYNDKTLFGFHANTWMTGIQLSVNIFNGNRTKHTIGQQQAEKEKLARQLDQQKNEARTAVNQAKRRLKDAAITIGQQQLAVEQAAELLRVLQNRYQQGLVTTTDVLAAHTQLAQQQLGAVQAVSDYNLAIIYLQFLTSIK